MLEHTGLDIDCFVLVRNPFNFSPDTSGVKTSEPYHLLRMKAVFKKECLILFSSRLSGFLFSCLTKQRNDQIPVRAEIIPSSIQQKYSSNF